MKKYLILLLLFTGCAAYQKISYSEPFSKVYEDLPGDRNQLFVKANEWMIKTFTSAESVVEFSDKEEGVLMGKYLMFGETRTGMYGVSSDTRVYAKIDIRIKDQRAMLTIEPMGEWYYDPSGFSIYKFGKDQCLQEMERLSESLHTSLMAKQIDF